MDSINMFSLEFDLGWPYIILGENLVFLFESMDAI